MGEGSHVQSVRVRESIRDRIDRLAKVLSERPPRSPWSRSRALICIIEAGLDELERQHIPTPPDPIGLASGMDGTGPSVARIAPERSSSESKRSA
jgi:hypothetical protein